MTQHVNSQHIPPVAIFVGGKPRHPFRIYRNKTGSLICDYLRSAIGTTSLHEISGTILNWLERSEPKEIVILDGVPVQGILSGFPFQRHYIYATRTPAKRSRGFQP
ncbi:MAG: PAC2 family protein [Nitrososphaerales archaeon]